jgi:hypothetical protein
VKRQGRALKRRYGHAKAPSWREVKKHEGAFEAGMILLNTQLDLGRDIDRDGRKYLRGILKEHDWLLKHCGTKA